MKSIGGSEIDISVLSAEELYEYSDGYVYNGEFHQEDNCSPGPFVLSRSVSLDSPEHETIYNIASEGRISTVRAEYLWLEVSDQSWKFIYLAADGSMFYYCEVIRIGDDWSVKYPDADHNLPPVFHSLDAAKIAAESSFKKVRPISPVGIRDDRSSVPVIADSIPVNRLEKSCEVGSSTIATERNAQLVIARWEKTDIGWWHYVNTESEEIIAEIFGTHHDWTVSIHGSYQSKSFASLKAAKQLVQNFFGERGIKCQ